MGEVVPLGARLRQRREELGLTQTQAAQQLDVARTAYRLWELEAARPAPDRWRGIATWLGISMTAMLLAEELIDEREAATAQRLAAGGGMTAAEWDATSDTSEGDYFSQERSMIGEQTRLGHISAAEAAQLRRVLDRLQRATTGDASAPWHAGSFRKRFPNTEVAPALARAALAATAIGIPKRAFDDTELVTSELVTNSVRHSGSDWVEVSIAVDAHVLRVEVSDQSPQSMRPRTPGVEGGWGLAILGELASRWGVERERAGKTVWFEYDLTPEV
jgi:transcriptional regulator with XRE-family HTH domain/anti-sigma regulatory factor (Ser/Thr protein kinase)